MAQSLNESMAEHNSLKFQKDTLGEEKNEFVSIPILI